ncbi:MAG: hypothetical protein A4E31_00222 [Methanomassiliicoccales archaeon PtaU1.Bin030]|nr:MAG: hypothetical protein A4E31_00222 [Methanomassiliicoccales archaeon PtaU1.Bin030]
MTDTAEGTAATRTHPFRTSPSKRNAIATVVPVDSRKERAKAARTERMWSLRCRPLKVMLHREKDIMTMRAPMATSLFILG